SGLDMRSIRYAAVAFAVACTAQAAGAADKPTLAGFTEAAGAERVMLVDQRPADDKTQSIGPLFIGNCAYGVFRVADDATEPSRMTLLRSDLAAGLGGQLDGRSITVRHYGLYFNSARELRHGAAAAGAAAGAAAAGGVGVSGPVVVAAMDPSC